jgi:hypothetical protein
VYDVFMYSRLDGPRMHRSCVYVSALKWIYDRKPAYVSVCINGKLLFKNEYWERALLLVVRHHNRKSKCPCGRNRCNCHLFKKG